METDIQEGWGVAASTPAELERRYLLKLSFECTDHLSKSYDSDNDKFAFAVKAEDLMFRLLRFTDKPLREELQKHYDEMKLEIAKVEEQKIDPQRKKKEILNIRYTYALPTHQHNMKLIPQTTMLERELEAEMDITNEEIIKIVREGRNKNDARIQVHG